jgi:glycine cleavage system H protein
MYPSDRRYSKEHEWISVDGNSATVGITDYAQDQLGDIVFVELPEVDKSIQKGDVIGTIESVKAVSEIYAPVSGTVTEVNTLLDDKPETVNGDPHGVGWYCKVRLADTGELDELMDAAAYQDFATSQ